LQSPNDANSQKLGKLDLVKHPVCPYDLVYQIGEIRAGLVAMAKRFSVNIENDEVLSIDIDGVLYDSPDDIPDPVDRSKAEAIIASMQEGNEAEFEREFDRQFANLQQESSRWSKLIIAIFLGVAGVLLLISILSAASTIRQLAKEQDTPGLVVDTIERRSVDSETGDVTWFSYPVVEFATPGDFYRVELSEGSSPPAYRAGDEVTILYDPDQPQRARIKSLSSSLLQWILPGITGIVGMVFLLVSIFAFRVIHE
jgi:hypothetical protein